MRARAQPPALGPPGALLAGIRRTIEARTSNARTVSDHDGRRARPGADDEPRLTFSQLQGLLREARAERPIYLVSPDAVTVQPTGHFPPGYDGRVPSTAEVDPAAPWAPLRRPVLVKMWGVRLVYGGVAALVAGAAGTAVATGTLGLPGLLASTVARVDAQEPSTRRRRTSVGGGG